MRASRKNCGCRPGRPYGHNVPVITTWFQGWSGLKNGTLLNAAEEADFDLFITADQELSYQQNLTRRHMSVLVAGTNRHTG